MKKVFIIATISLFVVLACRHKTYYQTVIAKDTTTHTTITPPVDTTSKDTTVYLVDTSVCFLRDVLPIFTGSCAKSGCHDAATKKDGYNLTSYSTIIAKGLVRYNSGASKIYTYCANGKMPQSPTPKLDSTQLSFIRRWINKGAPNDTDCAVICDTNTYTYSGAIKPIFQKYCYSCHATAVATTSGGSTILDTYTGVLVPVQNGKLMGDLKHLAGYNAMPQGGTMLQACQITQVKKWIDAGAQNN